jgi:hypothetical protein
MPLSRQSFGELAADHAGRSEDQDFHQQTSFASRLL